MLATMIRNRWLTFRSAIKSGIPSLVNRSVWYLVLNPDNRHMDTEMLCQLKSYGCAKVDVRGKLF